MEKEIKENKVKLLSEYKYFENIQNGLTFSQALEAVKGGLTISRRGWNGKGLYVKLYNDIVVSYHYSYMCPGLILHYPDGTVFTWVPSISDLLAEDWEVSDCD